MTTLLIHRARCIALMDDANTELNDASLLLKDGRIERIIPAGDNTDAEISELLKQVDEVIDARRHVVVPGLINTHHHMVQSLTRAVPQVQNAELFSWLKGLYPIWAGLTPEMVLVSNQVAMAELLLSGCTTSSDHLYIYPNGVRLDDSIEAAHTIGMRFTATRGSMSVGESQGGLPPDRVVEKEAFILKETQRLIETYHDASYGAMTHVAVAPCSPFSVSQDLMREAAKLARAHKVRLHTHLAENDHDIAYTKEKFNCTPAQYAEDLGWVGHDVWHAHCVKLDDEGTYLFARTRTGIAHCPCSNMRLASGILPLRKMLDAGVPIGLGVDGSASNDAAHLLNEARQAMLLARVGRALDDPRVEDGHTVFGCDRGPSEMTPRDALRLATRGGAEVLGRAHELGQIKEGYCADIAMFRTDTLSMAGGAVHDPVGALLLCASDNADYTIVNGRVVVRKGEIATVDMGPLIERHNQLAMQLAGR
ncbi:8-oxoguanine deaminase [Limnohabitans sp. TS-CS-82]|uniref:8-oxoguanine deaminase n=1 Tax=Limnohabitans sp. TS-CS-82 TaxID=2094193 RepID=UPI000CF23040|nr:8-oxoguanine deaminase [Limnohabitans sp. TS-CS-82]PQA84507.1 8-oxoguanine deaminase [Limnohabitans sp. TS-CS-82]